MKLKHILGILILAGAITACSSSNDDPKPTVPPTGGEPTVQPSDSIPADPTVPEPTIVVVDTMEVAVTELIAVADGGDIEFTTTTNQTYTVTTDVDWIIIKSDGRALTATYTVVATVSANEGKAREGNITVTFGDEASTAKSVVVKQEAAPSQEVVVSVGNMSTTTWVPQIVQ